MSERVNRRIERLVREEWPRLVATLVGELGDLSLAEDAAQDAAEVALTRWLDDGIPDRPGAWITTVARRRAVDRLRRERVGREKGEILARLESRATEEIERPEPEATVARDEQLGLIFGCCHPALAVEAQIALTLRSVAGLSTAEIARGFLVPEATMAQRLVRAKRKIASAAIPFRIPGDAELLSRIEVVHHVLYLVFNEGYVASSGDELSRSDLTSEAIRLTRLLASLLNDNAETHGQLALFLFVESRRPARTTAAGDMVLLSEQNRSVWNRDLIAEGQAAMERALALSRPGPYQIEAAINALHAEAESEGDTDWVQISMLYGQLRRHRPTATVGLNHAAAVAMACGPETGLAMLESGDLAERLDRYAYFHATRADLLRRLGDPEAAPAYRRALELTENEPEQRFLRRRLNEIGAGAEAEAET